jgi:hypothetical protein
MKSVRLLDKGSSTNIGDVTVLLEKSAEGTEEIHENHVWVASAPIGVRTMQVRKRSRTHYVICTKKSCDTSFSPWRPETLGSANRVICPPGPPPFSCPLADSAGPLGPVNDAISVLGSRDALKCRLLLSKCRSYLSFQNISYGNSRLPSPWLNSFSNFHYFYFISLFLVTNISLIRYVSLMPHVQLYFPHFHSNCIVVSSPKCI